MHFRTNLPCIDAYSAAIIGRTLHLQCARKERYNYSTRAGGIIQTRFAGRGGIADHWPQASTINDIITAYPKSDAFNVLGEHILDTADGLIGPIKQVVDVAEIEFLPFEWGQRRGGDQRPILNQMRLMCSESTFWTRRMA